MVGLVGLCVLAGSRWLLDGEAGASPVSLRGRCVVHGLVALAGVPFALRGGAWRGVRWVALAGAGVLLFGVPAVAEALAGGAVSQSGAALFTLTPLFVVVACGIVGDGAGRAPALVGMAGGLLVLPFRLPTTGREAVGFGLLLVAVLVTAGASVWVYGLLRGGGFAVGVVVVCGASALFLGGAGAVLEGASGGLARWGVGLDGVELALMLGLLRAVAPRRLASRFLLVPLLAAVEGVGFLRTLPDWRSCCGLVLMGVSGLWLLAGGKEEDAGGSPLGLAATYRE